jgi:hypothetical protein
MLIFFEKKGLKIFQTSLGVTEFDEKNGPEKIIVDFFVVIYFKIKSL